MPSFPATYRCRFQPQSMVSDHWAAKSPPKDKTYLVKWMICNQLFWLLIMPQISRYFKIFQHLSTSSTKSMEHLPSRPAFTLVPLVSTCLLRGTSGATQSRFESWGTPWRIQWSQPVLGKLDHSGASIDQMSLPEPLGCGKGPLDVIGWTQSKNHQESMFKQKTANQLPQLPQTTEFRHFQSVHSSHVAYHPTQAREVVSSEQLPFIGGYLREAVVIPGGHTPNGWVVFQQRSSDAEVPQEVGS